MLPPRECVIVAGRPYRRPLRFADGVERPAPTEVVVDRAGKLGAPHGTARVSKRTLFTGESNVRLAYARGSVASFRMRGGAEENTELFD